MKRSEMNLHERLAFDYVCHAMSELIGGYENALTDYPEDDEMYKTAKEFLSSGHDNLIDTIYFEVMSYSDKGTARHLRFAGEAFIKERISRRLTKWGY